MLNNSMHVNLTRALTSERLDEDLSLALVHTSEQLIKYVHQIVNDCTEDMVDLPLSKIQHGLRDLDVHVQVCVLYLCGNMCVYKCVHMAAVYV